MSAFKNKMKNRLTLKLYEKFRYLLTILSPTLNTKVVYRISKRKRINLKNPRTLDEKISWLKLNYNNENLLVTQCADKFAVREYVENLGLSHLLNKLYGAYDHENDIPWKELPDKFVLKLNHDSGSTIVCRDKSRFNIVDAKRKLRKDRKSKRKQYLSNAEMQYKGIKPVILCEKLIETPDNLLPVDYKFYCFNGEAKYVMAVEGREHKDPKFYFFDEDWNLSRINKDSKEAPKDILIEKPKNFDKMFEYANKLSQSFPFVRVDLYNVNGNIIFGELTFTPAGGIDSSRLPETELLFGDLLELPDK